MKGSDKTIKVKCLRGSKKLIKGAIYECTRLYYRVEDKKAGKTLKEIGGKSIHLKNFGSYSDFTRFETIDGKSLIDIEPFNTNYRKYGKRLTKDNVKKGSVVKCRYSSSKYLIRGENYIVKDVKIEINNWTTKPHLTSVKVYNGQNRWYTSYNFELLDIKEQRKLKIDEIGGKKEITTKKRKFEFYSEIKKISIIFKIISDIFSTLENVEVDRSSIDLESLIIERGAQHNIIKDDLKGLIDLKTISKKL